MNEALAFIEHHGVVLASAKGPVPRLTDVIAGEPVSGTWWAHAKGHAIFAVFEAIDQSPDILVCRLVNGKITFVHRRLWPALVRAAARFPVDHLARIRQEHSASGRHINHVVPFPAWADPDTMAEAVALGEQEAIQALGHWAISQRPSGDQKGQSQ